MFLFFASESVLTFTGGNIKRFECVPPVSLWINRNQHGADMELRADIGREGGGGGTYCDPPVVKGLGEEARD